MAAIITCVIHSVSGLLFSVVTLFKEVEFYMLFFLGILWRECDGRMDVILEVQSSHRASRNQGSILQSCLLCSLLLFTFGHSP